MTAVTGASVSKVTSFLDLPGPMSLARRARAILSPRRRQCKSADAGALQPSGTMIDVTHFTDPGCPWAYSAMPAHTTLRWRYGDQLRWTLVMIGLTEDAGQYAARGYTPTRSAIGYGRFRRFGMPFQITPKARLSATSPACRAVIATRLTSPELEEAALRALQFAQFTTTGTLDDPGTLRSALADVEGLDADAVVDRIDDPG